MARSRSNRSQSGSGPSNPSGSRLVYSTESRPSPAGGSGKKTRRKSGNPSTTPRAPADGVVRVWRQTKGRKGKGVTVVTGLQLPAEELSQLAGELKKKCGSGGTTKDGVIEIQGDHRDTLVDELRRRGHRTKLAGG